MFGYVAINPKELSQEEVKRYRAMYCGLCHGLKARYGLMGPVTLSYDMTFLYMVLSSLYEPEEQAGESRCAVHPLKRQPYALNRIASYCADMNIALYYFKCLDNWQDDRAPMGALQAKMLKKAYEQVEKQRPGQCRAIRRRLEEIGRIEESGAADIDALCNLTGEMLGAVYAWRDDQWQGLLKRMGQGIGRFIYLMDAYEDLEQDLKRGRFNPLRALSRQEDYQEIVRQALTMMIAEGTEAFEMLPLVQDVKILRSVLYSGIWGKYQAIQMKLEKKERKHGSVSDAGRIAKRNGG